MLECYEKGKPFQIVYGCENNFHCCPPNLNSQQRDLGCEFHISFY